ncbi:hypothetical protein [Xanthomonas graminis]|uniref:hypothetical protein n=1 Tax=Xanthomonas graminis TaxID=3390026 RepID=UPI001F400F3F|nr:hypothetical protein [Xanthomonas translucens]UKE72077.1 hypothetical protein KFS85_13475 [Xanthomonas translucens pv. phleipratensis]
MAMSLNFRRFHSTVIVLAALAAGSANAQNTGKVTIYYSNSVPNALAVQLITQKSDGSQGPVQDCTQLLGVKHPNITVPTGYEYTIIAMSTTNCAPGTGLAGLSATYEGFPAAPRGIDINITANGITGSVR